VVIEPRSLLFAPGNRGRTLVKARESIADAVIFDLEDAVPIAEKVSARAVVGEAVAPGRVPVYVRINPLDTPWGEADLRTVVKLGLTGVVLPKCESAAHIDTVDRVLTDAEQRQGMMLGSVEVMPLVETAAGVLRVAEIAASGSRVRRLAFGAYDFARDLSVALTGSGEELLVPRATIALAARAAGVQALDTPFADITDLEGLLADARRARQVGFSGKLCIHPSQLEPVHRVFTPSSEDVAAAYRVVTAFREAERSGRAAIAVDGKLVDYPIAEQQERLLERAAAFGLPVPGTAGIPQEPGEGSG
jgi:citrate lyase subunit beta/citryl-CoA lyase